MMRFLGLILLAGLCTHLVAAVPLAKPTVVAIEAELISDLEARHLQAGKLIFAKVSRSWSGLGCELPLGSILQAEVVEVTPQSKTSKGSEVALSFSTTRCGNSGINSLLLSLAAIAVPEEDESSISMDMPGGQIGSSAPSATDPSANQPLQSPSSGFRSVISSNAQLWDNMQHWFAADGTLRSGSIYGIKGMKLGVGTGPAKSSVLSSKDRNVALSKHTLLLLVPEAVAPMQATKRTDEAASRTDAAASAVAALANTDGSGKADAQMGVPSARATQADAPLLEEDSCTPPECSVAQLTNAMETIHHASFNLSIQGLGYSSRPQQEIGSLDQDETLSYLGANELLATFNPHPLVPRHGDASKQSTARVIRAALIDLSTRKILRTVDWRLPDKRQYLWPLANHRVLIHVENELRVYGPGLKVEARIALSSALSFVRTDPAGRMIAFGVEKERHTPELHAKLRASLEEEPEEDIQIQVLNERFETIASAISVSGRMPPILLNEGEVKLLRKADNSIRISLHTWDNQWRDLAHFKSSCSPDISSLAPDLLFLVTCNQTTGKREYRVMQANGKLVLQGQSSISELGQAAIGNEQKMEFAVRTIQANESLLPGGVFHLADLQSEQFGVYRAGNGKRLFTVSVDAPSASTNGYALAPDGHQLAVLARGQIALYEIQ